MHSRIFRSAVFLLVSLFSCFISFAQSADVVVLQKQIEADVWIPLFNGSNRFDAEVFLSTLSADIVRVSVDQKRAYGLAAYQKEIREGFARARERNVKRVSEARFLTRSIGNDHAYETGYFRSEVILASGEKRIRYSQFEFVLRIEKGKWRILVDRDQAVDANFGEKDYLKASPPHTSVAK